MFPRCHSKTPLDGGMHLPNNLMYRDTFSQSTSAVPKMKKSGKCSRSQDRKMLVAFSFPLQPISCINNIGAKHFLSHQLFILPGLGINSVS